MPKLLKFTLFLIVGGLAAFVLMRWLIARASVLPDNLGVSNGRLTPCPASPNCVSTQASDEQHAIEPIAYDGTTAVAHATLLAILQADASYTIFTDTPTYIQAEARTAVLHFVDDVEFYFDEPAGLIHFRSASRLGYGDAGANRQRMEKVRAAFQAAR